MEFPGLRESSDVADGVEFISADAKSVLISVNPNAGARSGQTVVDQLAERLTERGLRVEITSDIEQVASQSHAELKAGTLRAVVAAGGDGTVGLIANRTEPGVPIAILPLGTENLLSKYLGVKANPSYLCDLISQGATVKLDAGMADDRLFLLMLGCGFDAEVVRRLHSERKGHISHLSYAKPIIDSIRSYEYPELTVYCDPPHDLSDETSESKKVACRWVFVVNLPKYAGGLRIAPEATGTDGLLDVCTFKEGSLLHGLRYLTGIIFGQHQSWDDFASLKTEGLRIESERPVPYQLDGDPGGFLPVTIRVLPRRLTVLVDEAWAAKQGFGSAAETKA